MSEKTKQKTNLIQDVYENRHLVWKLAKNDFKTRYAGSYLGIFWAFVQPVVTVLVYWFVFAVGFRPAVPENPPFLLYLLAGIVPWFFFSDALNSGTNALIEYNYLVKKVVFKISVLPIIKLISALFVHGFFVLFTVVLFACYGHIPDLYTIQIFYYTLCMFLLVLGMVYATSAVVIFFRDLSQIINIMLQVGIWLTPIMWKLQTIPKQWQWVFKLNPLYYVVNGYRDAFYQKQWFFQHPINTLYFFGFTIAMYVIGSNIFGRLKVHFADVL